MEEVIDFERVDIDGRNIVNLACQNGDLERLKYLISKGGSLDVVDKYGRSCLHMACYGNHEDVIKYLLDEGVDVNATDNDNCTCLHAYSTLANIKLNILEMLLTAGVNVKAQSINGYTAFMRVCSFGSIAAIEMILDAGSDWRLKNNYDLTGLDNARSYNKKVAEWLEST